MNVKISVIIPVHNERKTIKELLAKVEAGGLEKQIIIVDDFSTDGTRELLETLSGEYEKKGHKIIFHEVNRGKGAAIRTAQPHVSGEIVIIQDADLEYDPSEYPNLIKPIIENKADVVFGSRFLGGPHRVLYYRHSLGNKFLTFVSNLFTDLNLTDMETCYKVFRADVFKMIPIKSNRFNFEPEMAAKVAKMGARVYEVPVSYNGRTYFEGKKITWKDGFSALFTMVKYLFVDDLDGSDPGYKTLLAMSKIESYNKYLFDFLSPYLGKSVAEVGCGIGNLSKYLIKQADMAYLTDIEDRYIVRMKNLFFNLPYVKVMKTSAEELGTVMTEKVDSVVCLNVLEHIEDERKALSSFHSVLNPGGNLLLIVPAHEFLYGNIDKSKKHYRRYTKKSVISVLEENGFAVKKIRFLNLISVPGWFISGRIFKKSSIPYWQIKAVNLLMPWLYLERYFNLPCGLSLFVAAEKK